MKVIKRSNSSERKPRISKRLLTTSVSHSVRGAFFVALLFGLVNMTWLAQGQPQSNNTRHSNSEASRNVTGTPKAAKTIVRVHDTAQRPQLASPQLNYSVTSTRAPSGTICGVESRAAH